MRLATVSTIGVGKPLVDAEAIAERYVLHVPSVVEPAMLICEEDELELESKKRSEIARRLLPLNAFAVTALVTYTRFCLEGQSSRPALSPEAGLEMTRVARGMPGVEFYELGSFDWDEDTHEGLVAADRLMKETHDASRWLDQSRDISQRDPAEADRLRHAREALSRLDEESREEGFEPCSAVAKTTAARLLGGLFRWFPRDYEVYPTSHREVAVEAPGTPGRGVLVLCDSGGGATCFVTIDGKNRRARYDDASRLPDLFVIEAMRELERA